MPLAGGKDRLVLGRISAGACLAAVLLAACSSGHAQRTGAVPGTGTALGGSPTQSGFAPASPGAKNQLGSGHQAGKSGAGSASGKHGAAIGSGGSTQAGHNNPAAALRPKGLNAQTVRTLVAALPKPSVRPGGPSLTFSAPVYIGASILGDMGSASWNISHRDADGALRTWGSALYVSSTTTNALAVLRHSPAVAHYCPRGSTPLPGFHHTGTVTVAVVCPDVHSPGAWWTVFERADRTTYLVVATSDSSRAETVATGSAAFRALTATVPRLNIQLALFKPTAEPH